MKYSTIIAIVCTIFLLSCSSMGKGSSKSHNKLYVDSIQCQIIEFSIDKLIEVNDNGQYVLNKKVDLKGQTYKFPTGTTIIVDGGYFFNGGLIGEETKIEGGGCLFDQICIGGSWNVSNISTSMFRDLSDVNSLKNVMALASPNHSNKIIIENGDYLLSAVASSAVVNIPSNTEVELRGNIRLLPNDFTRFYVIGIIQAENVEIKGSGAIYGDLKKHYGTEGEWGHGIYVASSRNVKISGISVNDCWGDCIYVGNNSNSIEIKKCNISYGRRQGISITSANDVKIEYCNIINIGGTNPGCGIDIEPNKESRVDQVVLNQVSISNCYRGISVGCSGSAFIGKVIIRNCNIFKTENKSPIMLRNADDVTIERCYVESDTRNAITAVRVNTVKILGNQIKSQKKSAIAINDCKKHIEEQNIVVKK